METKNINVVIANFDENVKKSIFDKIDKLNKCVQEMHNIYYDHERFFDLKWWAERLGLDNVQSSISYELPYILNSIVSGPDYTKAYQEDIDCFQSINHRMDCEGYGPNSMARGFSASNPCSLLWVETTKALKILEDIDKIIKSYVK